MLQKFCLIIVIFVFLDARNQRAVAQEIQKVLTTFSFGKSGSLKDDYGVLKVLKPLKKITVYCSFFESSVGKVVEDKVSTMFWEFDKKKRLVKKYENLRGTPDTYVYDYENKFEVKKSKSRYGQTEVTVYKLDKFDRVEKETILNYSSMPASVRLFSYDGYRVIESPQVLGKASIRQVTTYDSLQRPISLENFKDTSLLVLTNYLYDTVNNLIKEKETLFFGSWNTTRVRELTYAKNNLVSKETIVNDNEEHNTEIYHFKYTYNNSGDWISLQATKDGLPIFSIKRTIEYR